MAKVEYTEAMQSCPYMMSQRVLSGQWSMYLMHLLSDGPIRFNELKRRMPENMTHTTLSRQLKFLEEGGLVIRQEYSQVPPKVEYSLSEIGKRFQPVLDALSDWGMEYIEFYNKVILEENPHK